MTTGTIYRNMVALLFLALFTFIAMPVQVWHHHAGSSCKTIKDTQSGKKAAEAGISEKTSETGCSICDHEYAAYTAVHPLRLPAPELHRRVPAELYACHLPSPHAPVFCNKGPPALG